MGFLRVIDKIHFSGSAWMAKIFVIACYCRLKFLLVTTTKFVDDLKINLLEWALYPNDIEIIYML
jgi:hypothetical protein